jgi:hypothetical protein
MHYDASLRDSGHTSPTSICHISSLTCTVGYCHRKHLLLLAEGDPPKKGNEAVVTSQASGVMAVGSNKHA